MNSKVDYRPAPFAHRFYIPDEVYFPERPSGVPLQTLSKLYDFSIGFVILPSFEASILLYLRSPNREWFVLFLHYYADTSICLTACAIKTVLTEFPVEYLYKIWQLIVPRVFVIKIVAYMFGLTFVKRFPFGISRDYKYLKYRHSNFD